MTSTTPPFGKYSQIGQDFFAWCITPSPKGTFLDIGCSDGRTGNNTFALELLGWKGLCLDSNTDAIAKAKQFRQAHCTAMDATTYDYSGLTGADYLSLDVDGASLATLERMALHPLAFRAITSEHDFYALGDSRRTLMRALLTPTHELLFADVCHNGLQFEDWWVHRGLFEPLAALRASGLEGKECLTRLETHLKLI